MLMCSECELMKVLNEKDCLINEFIYLANNYLFKIFLFKAHFLYLDLLDNFVVLVQKKKILFVFLELLTVVCHRYDSDWLLMIQLATLL